MLGRKFPLAAGLPIEPNTLSWLPTGFQDKGIFFSNFKHPSPDLTLGAAINHDGIVETIDDQVYGLSVPDIGANGECEWKDRTGLSNWSQIRDSTAGLQYVYELDMSATIGTLTLDHIIIVAGPNHTASIQSVAVGRKPSVFVETLGLATNGGKYGLVARDNSGTSLAQPVFSTSALKAVLIAVDYINDTYRMVAIDGTHQTGSLSTAHGTTVDVTHIYFVVQNAIQAGVLVLNAYPTESEAYQICDAWDTETGGGYYTGPAS